MINYDSAPPTLNYITTSSLNVAGATQTHLTVSLGDERADRAIIVSVGANGLLGFTSVTINGVSATKAAGATNTDVTSEIWAARVPSGTTGAIVLTSAMLVQRSIVDVYSSLNLLNITPNDTAADTTGTIDLPTDVSARGVVIAGATTISSGATGAAAWSGVSENSETTITTAVAIRHSSGGLVATSALSPLSIACTGLLGVSCGCSASFR